VDETEGAVKVPDGRRRRWQAHREARRAELVQAAVRAIRAHGPDIGMDAVATEAGVSKPVLYRHFTDQNDLAVAVGQFVGSDLLATVARELDKVREPHAHARAVIDSYLAAIESEPELYRYVTRRPADADLLAGHRAMIAEHLTRVLGERMREFGLDSGAAEPWAYGLVGMVECAGDWWLERRSMSRDSLTGYLTSLIWSGFLGGITQASKEAGAADDGTIVPFGRKA
jgi:AcrR family transcriptional regulator